MLNKKNQRNKNTCQCLLYSIYFRRIQATRYGLWFS